MASNINADNGVVSGSAGLKTSADSSGVLALQTNGTTAVTVDTSQNATFNSTGAMTLPSGTTGQRPASPTVGMSRYNTTLGTGEMYTSAGWVNFPDLSPIINTITGNIFKDFATTLTVTGTNFGSGSGTVTFTSGATVANVSVTPASTTSLSVLVPSTIIALSASSVVSISFTNSLGKVSNGVNKTVIAIPSGGTITQVGSYLIHTFTSSGNLVVPSGFTSSADYLIIAGGGGGGHNSAPPQFSGGGAGGVLTGTTTLNSSVTYNFVVGGGSGGASYTNGSNSTGFSLTAIGGGYGGGGGGAVGGSGGSGGGQGGSGGTGPSPNNASGTAGQGNAGGSATFGPDAGGGGGGYGSVGQNAVSTTSGNGGTGLTSSISGTSTNYAGGGGRLDQGFGGGFSGSPNGVANRGGGGGGTAGAGGSGIVIVRYLTPT